MTAIAPPAPPLRTRARAAPAAPVRSCSAGPLEHPAPAEGGDRLVRCSSRSVFVAGGAAGTRLLTSAEQGTGESGRADRVVEQAGYPATLTERVLIRPAGAGRLDAGRGAAVRPTSCAPG